MKKRIHIKAPFDLVLEGGETRSFKPGVQVVDEAIAEHWYVKAMSEEPSEEGDSTDEEMDYLVGQVEALTARAEAAEAEAVDLKARAEKAEAEVEALTARVKALEEDAPVAAADAKAASGKKA